MIISNINRDDIYEAFSHTPSNGDWAPNFVERMEAEHEWINNEWMLGIVLDPVVRTAVNQESSKGNIFSMLFFLGEQLGDFLVACA